MATDIIVYLIIALCCYFIGRRFFNQFKAALSKKKNVACCDGCSSCSVSSTCDDKKD